MNSWQRTDSHGVSSVVGVILMVAVTVIIAAVIGNFALDLGTTPQEPPNAAVSIDQTYTGPPETGTVQIISMTPGTDFVAIDVEEACCPGHSVEYFSGGTWNDMSAVGPAELRASGEELRLRGLDRGDEILVTATTGESTVLLQRYTVE